MSTNATVEKLVSLCKRRGFIFQSSEIYGGIGGFWDYGPLGVELKNNIKRAWWKAVVQERDDVVGLDAAILMNPTRLEGQRPRRRPSPTRWWTARTASGASAPTTWRPGAGQRPRPRREAPSSLPRVRRRADRGPHVQPDVQDLRRARWRTTPRVAYLRPETAQGIFVNFDNVLTDDAPEAALRHRPDRQGLPQRDHARQLHLPRPRVRADGDRVLRQARHGRGVARALGGGALQLVPEPGHAARRTCACAASTSDELAHYAKARSDVEYLFPMGWSRAGGHRQPHRLRPRAATPSSAART